MKLNITMYVCDNLNNYTPTANSLYNSKRFLVPGLYHIKYQAHGLLHNVYFVDKYLTVRIFVNKCGFEFKPNKCYVINIGKLNNIIGVLFNTTDNIELNFGNIEYSPFNLLNSTICFVGNFFNSRKSIIDEIYSLNFEYNLNLTISQSVNVSNYVVVGFPDKNGHGKKYHEAIIKKPTLTELEFLELFRNSKEALKKKDIIL